jgi:hypothetical protein
MRRHPEHLAFGCECRSGDGADPWIDCRCGWRNYVEPLIQNPLTVSASLRASSVEPPRCGSRGEELDDQRVAA